MYADFYLALNPRHVKKFASQGSQRNGPQRSAALTVIYISKTLEFEVR